MSPLLLILPLLLNVVEAKISEGVIHTDEKFTYLDRFCYESELGQLEFTFRYPTGFPTPSLLLYYDEPDQWLKAYTQVETCEEKLRVIKEDPRGGNGIVRLTPYGTNPYSSLKCVIMNKGLEPIEFVQCTGAKTFTSARSRWWFLALSVCQEEGLNSSGISVDYRLVMTNGQPSDFFTYHFSFDQRYILPITLVFICVVVTLILTSCIVGCQLQERRLYHNTYKMFTQAMLMKAIGLLFAATHYFCYAVNGVGLPTTLMTSNFFTYASEIIFMFMLLLLSRGLNIVKMRLSKLEIMFLAIMIAVFLGSYIGIHFWEVKGFDPALVYYRSESLPGKLVAGWKCVAWFFVMVSSIGTLRGFPQKRWFYVALMIFFTPWFFSGPVMVVIANHVLDNWVREEVVYLVENCVAVYGYLIFIYLSWPSIVNKHFPFHIRTTQISCSFDPQVNYAATDNNAEPKVTITPRRTVEERCRYFEVQMDNRSV